MNPKPMQLTLYAEGFLDLASPSLSPDSSEARQMTATSGRRLLESLALCGQDTLSLRTLLASSAWRSTRCLLTWKLKATPAGRRYCQLRVSMPRTAGIEFSLWPTPRAEERQQHNSRDNYVALSLAVKMLHTPTSKANQGSPSMAERDAGSWFLTKDNLLTTPCADDTGLRTARYQQGGTPLSMQVAAMEGMLPTPGTPNGGRTWPQDAEVIGNSAYRPNGQKVQIHLHHVAEGMLPTPRHEDHDAGAHRGQPDSLHSCVKMLPTPRVVDVPRGPNAQGGASLSPTVMLPTPLSIEHKFTGEDTDYQRLADKSNLSGVVMVEDGRTSLKLNPDWVNRMQGFPDNWLEV